MTVLPQQQLMTGGFLRLSIMAVARTNYGDCVDKLTRDVFEEGGRVRITVEVLVVVVCCV